MKSLLRTLQFVAQFITLGLALAFVVSLFAPQSVERLRAALQRSAPVEAPESGPSARAAVAPAASTPAPTQKAAPRAPGFGPLAPTEPSPEAPLASYALAVNRAAPSVVSIYAN